MNDIPLPVLIQFTAKRSSQMLEEGFAKAGLQKLHMPLGQILALLHSRNDVSASDIQSTLRLSKSTVSEALNELCEKGLIEYVVNEDDRREKKIIETEKGKTYQESAWKVLKEYRVRLLDGLSEEQQQALRDALNIIIENTKGGCHD